MSSFICSPKHFNSVEWNLRQLIIYGHDFYLPYELKDKYKILSDRKQNAQERERELQNICDTLRELNAVCVTLQYKDHYAGTLDKQIRTEKEYLLSNRKNIKPEILSVRGLYNALRCLNYQIEFEHLKDIFGINEEQKNALKFLKSIIDALAHHIIDKLPEENGNKWSIE